MKSSLLVAALERTWESLQQNVDDLPNVHLGVTFGKNWHGAAWANRGWVAISAAAINEGAISVFDTLVHEAVHVLATERGILDVGAPGKGRGYHNEAFRDLAHKVFGLGSEHDSKIGWSWTVPPSWLIEQHITDIEKIERALNA